MQQPNQIGFSGFFDQSFPFFPEAFFSRKKGSSTAGRISYYAKAGPKMGLSLIFCTLRFIRLF